MTLRDRRIEANELTAWINSEIRSPISEFACPAQLAHRPAPPYDMYMTTESSNLEKWAKTWQKAESALQQVKTQELQNFDMDLNADLVDGMLQCAFDHSLPRQSSGLVEQQRLFAACRPETS